MHGNIPKIDLDKIRAALGLPAGTELVRVPSRLEDIGQSRGPKIMFLEVIGIREAPSGMGGDPGRLPSAEEATGLLNIRKHGEAYLVEHGVTSGNPLVVRALLILATAPGLPLWIQMRWNGQRMTMAMHGLEDATMRDIDKGKALVSALKHMVRSGRPTGSGVLKNLSLEDIEQAYRDFTAEQGKAPTKADLAAVFGVSESTLSRRIAEGGLNWPPG